MQEQVLYALACAVFVALGVKVDPIFFAGAAYSALASIAMRIKV